MINRFRTCLAYLLAFCLLVTYPLNAAIGDNIETDEEGGIWDWENGTYTAPDGSVYQIVKDDGDGEPSPSSGNEGSPESEAKEWITVQTQEDSIFYISDQEPQGVNLPAGSSVVTGDLENTENAGHAVNILAHEGEISLTTGEIIQTSETNGIPAVNVITNGTEAKVTLSTEDISGINGVTLTNESSTAVISTGDITANVNGVDILQRELETSAEGSGKGASTTVNTGKITVTGTVPDEDFERSAGLWIDDRDGQDHTLKTVVDGGIEVTSNMEKSREGIYALQENTTNSQMTLEIKGDIDIESRGPEAVCLNASGNNESVQSMRIDGDVNVLATGAGGADGVSIIQGFDSTGSATDFILNGDITVTETAGDHASAFSIETAGEENTAKAKINGNVEANGGNACAIGINAKDSGTSEIEMTGNATANGWENSAAVSVSTYGEDSRATFTLTGNATADRDESKIESTHWEQNDCSALSVSNTGGTAVLTVKGEVIATGEDATGIRITTNNQREYSGEYEGEIKEEELYKTDRQDWIDEEGKEHKTVIRQYYNEEDNFFYSTVSDDGVLQDASEKWTETPVEGSVEATVIGDVTSDGTALSIDSENNKATVNVLVDGTLSGKEHAIVLTEQTELDNLTLTVWKVDQNSGGNIAERVTQNNEDATPEYTADRETEKKIQYIIRLDQPEAGGTFTTEGTREYQGYNVANEGDTVTLKLNIQDGYRITGAYNGTDTKAELLQDAAGNYYLVVPKGGGVQLSVSLEKIEQETETEEPAQEALPPAEESVQITDVTGAIDTTQLTPVTNGKKAALKPANETTETHALKNRIKELIKNNKDILSLFTDEIKNKITNITTITNTITLTIENYDETMGTITLTIKPDKPYTKGETVQIVIALPDGNGGYLFFYIEGEGQEDGTLALNIPAATAKALVGKTFVTVIVK